MSCRQLNEEWTAKVVGRMHRYRITRLELASKCHYSITYISLVLNGNKEFKSERSKQRTREKIEKNLKEIEDSIKAEIKAEESTKEKWYEYFDKT